MECRWHFAWITDNLLKLGKLKITFCTQAGTHNEAATKQILGTVRFDSWLLRPVARLLAFVSRLITWPKKRRDKDELAGQDPAAAAVRQVTRQLCFKQS